MIGLDVYVTPRRCPPLTHCTDAGNVRVGDDAQMIQISQMLNRIYAHHEKQPLGPDKLVPNVVTCATARDLVTIALEAIDKARAIMPSGFFIPSQETTIENRRNALLSHKTAIDACASPAAPYPGKDALRQDVTASFAALGGALEAASAASRLSYWDEVGKQLSAVGDAVWEATKIAADAAGKVVSQVTTGVKTVYWTTIGLAVGLVGVVGLIAWKLITSGAVTEVGKAFVTQGGALQKLGGAS